MHMTAPFGLSAARPRTHLSLSEGIFAHASILPSLTTIASPLMAAAARCRFLTVNESPIKLGRPFRILARWGARDHRPADAGSAGKLRKMRRLQHQLRDLPAHPSVARTCGHETTIRLRWSRGKTDTLCLACPDRTPCPTGPCLPGIV